MTEGTEKNPIHMKIVGTEVSLPRMLAVGLISLVPVAAAILMQNPALRQSLQMRFWDEARKFAGASSRGWAKLESIAATRYDIARL